MSFTYNLATPNDITRVRYHVRDTDSTAAMFPDEEISFRLSEAGDWKHAVIDMLEAKIIEMANTPDFSSGSLRVNNASAIQSLQTLLRIKRNELGIPLITAEASYIYRPDNTNTTSAPTFDSAADTDLDDDDDT